MGYYTRHELEIVKGDNDLIEAFREVSEGAQCAINGSGDSEESCKWYNHQDELKKFSLLHPEALFKLSGEGEESGEKESILQTKPGAVNMGFKEGEIDYLVY